MKLFVKKHDSARNAESYIVIIKYLMQFSLTMDHVAMGMSFCQVVQVIQHTKDHIKITKLTSVNDIIVKRYVRVLSPLLCNI